MGNPLENIRKPWKILYEIWKIMVKYGKSWEIP
jgi:hypothetical protein